MSFGRNAQRLRVLAHPHHTHCPFAQLGPKTVTLLGYVWPHTTQKHGSHRSHGRESCPWEAVMTRPWRWPREGWWWGGGKWKPRQATTKWLSANGIKKYQNISKTLKTSRLGGHRGRALQTPGERPYISEVYPGGQGHGLFPSEDAQSPWRQQGCPRHMAGTAPPGLGTGVSDSNQRTWEPQAQWDAGQGACYGGKGKRRRRLLGLQGVGVESFHFLHGHLLPKGPYWLRGQALNSPELKRGTQAWEGRHFPWASGLPSALNTL